MLKNVGTFITQRHYNVPKNNKNASWNLVFSFIVFKRFQLIVKVFLTLKTTMRSSSPQNRSVLYGGFRKQMIKSCKWFSNLNPN